MPKEYKKVFKAGHIVGHVRKKPNGVFEIRCQIRKIKIAVSSKHLDTAKEKFSSELNCLFVPTLKQQSRKKIILCDYMLQWLETVKKSSVKPVTYNDYIQNLNIYIRPSFGGRAITEIKGFELQTFINQFVKQEKFRTAIKLYQLLNAVFNYAVMDDIINKSPMQRISIPRYEQEHGTPLDRSEELKLINALTSSKDIYAQAYVFLTYTGLRRSELATAELDDGWIKITTSKQRKGMKEKRRCIPVCPMLKRVLPFIDFEAIKSLSKAMLTKHIKDYFPNHHTHNLRHTFITRCQECGIQRELVSLWAGHKADSSTTTLVYTHLEQNKEHQIEEMQKFDYTLI